MRELNDIEDLFVREVLDTHGEYIVDLLQESIESKKLRLTDELLESLDYKVRKSSNGYFLEVSFLTYGRFIEINFFKSRAIRKHYLQETGDIKRLRISGNSSENFRRQKKKDTRFYAKNVYGSINRLLGRMSSEYSDQEIARLKGILQNRITSSI